MAENEADDPIYQAKDALEPALKASAVTGIAGIFAGSVQAALQRRNLSAFATFVRYGQTVAIFTAMGGTFEFFRTASANLREKDDSVNHAIGGFTAGALIGLRARTIPAVLGYGVALAVTMAAYNTAGGTMFTEGLGEDEYIRKEVLRGNKRKPIKETIDELGEGRGIYGPGYEERRRERIKQRYGIDVPTPTSTS